MADRQKTEELRDQFFKETGYTWENSQGEPDIDYVYWLENKVIHAQQVVLSIDHPGQSIKIDASSHYQGKQNDSSVDQ